MQTLAAMQVELVTLPSLDTTEEYSAARYIRLNPRKIVTETKTTSRNWTTFLQSDHFTDHAIKAYKGTRGNLHWFLTLTQDGGEWSSAPAASPTSKQSLATHRLHSTADLDVL